MRYEQLEFPDPTEARIESITKTLVRHIRTQKARRGSLRESFKGIGLVLGNLVQAELEKNPTNARSQAKAKKFYAILEENGVQFPVGKK